MNLFNNANLRLWEKGSEFVDKDTDQQILNAVRRMCEIRKIIMYNNITFCVGDSFETKDQKISENVKKMYDCLNKYFEENNENMETFIWLYDLIAPIFYDHIQEIIFSQPIFLESEATPADRQWNESPQYNCQIGKHYQIANNLLHMIGNSYVITDQDENTTTIFITGE